MEDMERVNTSQGRKCVLHFCRYAFISMLVFMASIANLRWCAAADDFEASEYEIKATYLLNFASFVDWPDSPTSDSQTPIHVCLLGQDPLESTLSRMVADHRARGKALLLRRVLRTEAVSDCQILYICPSESKSIRQVLESLRNASVLTVGETDQFAEQGGMIQLVLMDKQIRFKINPTAASQAGLRISAKLLVLAQIVGPRPSFTASHN